MVLVKRTNIFALNKMYELGTSNILNISNSVDVPLPDYASRDFLFNSSNLQTLNFWANGTVYVDVTVFKDGLPLKYDKQSVSSGGYTFDISSGDFTVFTMDNTYGNANSSRMTFTFT